MAIHVRDAETDRVVRRLAETTGTSITEAIRDACAKALEEAGRSTERQRRLDAMQEVVDRLNRDYPVDESVVIDKAFFDALNDE